MASNLLLLLTADHSCSHLEAKFRNRVYLGFLWMLIQDSQGIGFYGLPAAKGKLVAWLPGEEIFA